MVCVNRSSSEFKNLAQKNNVSIGTLELITHKYWNETGSSESLPSDLYIQVQLGNTQYIEKGKNVRELWQHDYSKPLTFPSLEKVQEAAEKARNYFPEQAIVYYESNNDNYILNIKEPVSEINELPINSTNKQKYSTVKLNNNQTAIVDFAEQTSENPEKHIVGIYNKNQNTAFPEIAFADINDVEIPEASLADIQITKDLINHLRNSGITVHNRAEMQEFLKHHSINSIQAQLKSEHTVYVGNTKYKKTHQVLENLKQGILPSFSDKDAWKIIYSHDDKGLAEAIAIKKGKKVFDAFEKIYSEIRNAEYQAADQTNMNTESSIYDKLEEEMDREYQQYQDTFDLLQQLGYIDKDGKIVDTKDSDIGTQVDLDSLKRKSPELYNIITNAQIKNTLFKAPNGKDTNLSPIQWVMVRTKKFKDWFGDWEKDPQHSSKIVDENGEPKAVYHGTHLGGFTQFDPAKSDDKISIFSFGDVNGANTYAFGDITNDRGKDTSISIESGEEWITNKNLEDYIKEGYVVTEEQKKNYEAGKTITIKKPDNEIPDIYIYKLFLNIRNPLIVDAKGSYWNSIPFNLETGKEDDTKKVKTRDVSKYAKDKGYDGVMFNNMIDVGGNTPLYNTLNSKESQKFLDSLSPEVRDNLEFYYGENALFNITYDANDEFNYYKNISSAPVYISYASNQLKSASDYSFDMNNGTYSPNNSDIRELRTDKGELLGFAYKGQIYLDEGRLSPDVPLHEYTHLWDIALAKINPALWKKGVELMKKGVPSLWNEVANSEKYGKLWESQNITGEKLENLIASEVHARLIGKHGKTLIEDLAAKKGSDNIIQKLKEWCLEAWRTLKSTFTDWSDDEINMLTLKDFNHMTVRDFIEGINPSMVNEITNATFKGGTVINGTDVSGRSVNWVYQNLIKKSKEGQPPSKDSILSYWRSYFQEGSAFITDEYPDLPKSLIDKMRNNAMADTPLSKQDNEDITYYLGYLPLMKEWAKQNPEIIEELKRGTEKPGINDMFNALPAMQVRALAEITNNDAIKQNKSRSISVTAAPYYHSPLTKDNYKELREKIEKDFFNKANTFAQSLGITILSHTVNVGGFNYKEGERAGQHVDELSYSFELDTNDKDKADLFACLMGDLGHEQQEAVISANYSNRESANALQLSIKVKETKGLIEQLKQVGLTDYTIDTTNKTISLLAFEQEDEKTLFNKIEKLIEIIGDKNYEGINKEYIQSRYLDKKARSATYEKISRNDNWKQNNRQLYLYTREAYSKLTGKDLDTGKPITGETTVKGASSENADSEKVPQPSELGEVAFEESDKNDYWTRTKENASKADITIAIAEDFKSIGEMQTRKAAGNKYTSIKFGTSDVSQLIRDIRNNPNYKETGIILNIAGNELSTLSKFNNSQQTADSYVYYLVTALLKNGIVINGIRSGGQTGIDEAGIKAAMYLNIPSTVLAPKGWRMRGSDNKDVYDETAFKTRFNSDNVSILKNEDIKTLGIIGENSFSVKLPYYNQYNNETLSTIRVDAKWKIPLLKFYDKQLSEKLSEEDKNEIIEQMKTIINAVSEDDINTDIAKNKEKVKEDIDYYDKLNSQFNNLLDSEVITASEIREAAEDVANLISDMITAYQNDTELAKKDFNITDDNLDLSKMSRRDIVQTIGINNLLEKARKRFCYDENDYLDDVDDIIKSDHIVNNWDAFILLGSDTFILNEGFCIVKSKSNNKFEVQDEKEGSDDLGNSSDSSQIQENEGSEQEYWQVNFRTIDIFDDVTASVRKALHECYLLDANGNKVLSKWGIPKRANVRNAVNSLLRWTKDDLTINDVIKTLQDKQHTHTWLSGILKRLEDASGKETDFQSQFFSFLYRNHQNYSIVEKQNGQYVNIAVNSNPALRNFLEEMHIKIKYGEHPLFRDGVIEKYANEIIKIRDRIFDMTTKIVPLQDITSPFSRNNKYSVWDIPAEDLDYIIKSISWISLVMGFPTTEDDVRDTLNNKNLKSMIDGIMLIALNLKNELELQKTGEFNGRTKGAKLDPGIAYDPLNYNYKNSIETPLRKFLAPLVEKVSDTASNSFYQDGKMYQNYVTPSRMSILLTKMKMDKKKFDDFIKEEYGDSEWYRYQDVDESTDATGGYRVPWLRWMKMSEAAHNVFDHKVELLFDGDSYMKTLSPEKYTLSAMTEYFADAKYVENFNAGEQSNQRQTRNYVTAWYRMPMQSNKPSSEFIKFISIRHPQYKNEIVSNMYSMLLQEMDRIITVRMRKEAGVTDAAYKSFDKNGAHFCYFPYMNVYLEEGRISERTYIKNADGSVSEDNSKLAELLHKKLSRNELSAEEKAQLMALCKKAIYSYMQIRANKILDEYEKTGILEAAKKIKGIWTPEAFTKGHETPTDKDIRDSVENFIWNDNFASKNILNILVGDIAFYKDTEDLQKRLAQLHSPGIRGNIYATDYEGNRVSDGTYRTFIAADLDNVISNTIDNLTEIFDRKIRNASEAEKPAYRALKEILVGKEGKYRHINATDAQGFSSPSSRRKKSFIFGKWSREAEAIYKKLLDGTYTYTDLMIAFQVDKPFLYSVLHRDISMGIEGSPIKKMPVPFQAKNSEYLLILADAIIQGEDISHPNMLRAIYDVMEESERLNPTKGIDTVQFESTIKSGLQGKIDLSPFLHMEGGTEAAKAYMKSLIYKRNNDGTLSTEYNTDTYVYETSYENYCIQQKIPEHYKEHAQSHGSQVRAITVADLDVFIDPAKAAEESNMVKYEFTEADGTKKSLTAEEFREEYENTIAANIDESINNLSKELCLDSFSKTERNVALSKILQREILSSPRYGVDLFQACSVDKETGEFRIPKGDPIQAKRIEQLVNSLIKNRINKQEIAGGPIVQVSNFGTSRQLNIRFKDKYGNLLPTKEEYEKTKATSDLPYNEWIKNQQAGIAYFECFAPIWSNDVFYKFRNRDGSIDIEAIEATNPELLKLIGYRIPTEAKYSVAPLKIVGFTPREAGDAIILPYEITTINDSDFDIDKDYVMRKDIPITVKDNKDIEKAIFNELSKAYPKLSQSFLRESIHKFVEKPNKFKGSRNNMMAKIWKTYKRVAYEAIPATSGKVYRDNKIVEMTWTVLTHETSAEQVLTPGGFDELKVLAYRIAAFKSPNNKNLSWAKLKSMNIDELKSIYYTPKDLTFIDTQVQFYRQNSAGSSLIGIFAVAKIAQALLQYDDIHVDIPKVCGADSFTIAGKKFEGNIPVFQVHTPAGELLGKIFGACVAASADSAKDPIYELVNVNTTTANLFISMLNIGITPEIGFMLLGQDVVTKVLQKFNRENITGYTTLNKVINSALDDIKTTYNIDDSSIVNKEELTEEELIRGLLPNSHPKVDYKVLLTLKRIKAIADVLRGPIFTTRFNSISSAVGPLIVDNLIMENKVFNFSGATDTHLFDSKGKPINIDTILNNHPMLREFSRTLDIANTLLRDMPAASVQFKEVLNSLNDSLTRVLYNDRKLLSQLSDFYQSYLAVASGLINPNDAKRYLDNFPVYFLKQGFKEQYMNNALIQAIEVKTIKRTGRLRLNVNTVGMKEEDKEKLKAAWIDLHRANPELSKMLVDYNFFLGGIGYSPKGFMSLVPTYVKEHLSREVNGKKVTYLDTYRNFPEVIPATVIDQFIRNNSDNNKLVPFKGGKESKFLYNKKMTTLKVTDEKELKDLKDVPYFKTSNKGETILWKRAFTKESEYTYKRIDALGNNGEYLELHPEDYNEPLTVLLDESLSTSLISTEDDPTSELDYEKRRDAFIDAIMNASNSKNYAQYNTVINGIKDNLRKGKAVEKYQEYFQKVFDKIGVKVDKNNVLNEFYKYC